MLDYYSGEEVMSIYKVKKSWLYTSAKCKHLPYCESSPYQQGKSGCKEPAFEDGCGACNGRKGSKRTVISNDFSIIHQLL